MSTQRATGEPGLRERKKRETRQRISDVATGLFVERGFDEVTVAEIARAAEVSPMTVFNYFPRKEDLFLDRIPEAVELVAEAVRGRAPGEHPLTALRRLALGLLGTGHPLSGARARFRPFLYVVAASPALRARAREAVDEVEHALTEALAETAPDVPDPRLLAALVIAAYRAVGTGTVARLLADTDTATEDTVTDDTAADDALAEDHRLRLTAAFDALDRAFAPPAP
ncbi:TetR family transcriptional regulator [Streptomyces sp. SAT1]|uniref:TetR/AcrR family transcriptional regulator n=1 Tax=Streptomyces sp. SAT1 TaxID=1849967 RepID=UPI0007DD4E39|nr:TetR/AcrR family transcriptional regulator [Streptomyces sp. SAT1]ANH91271.1 TetR family transcriptional regulator [Streptomyces sp. SAT1]